MEAEWLALLQGNAVELESLAEEVARLRVLVGMEGKDMAGGKKGDVVTWSNHNNGEVVKSTFVMGKGWVYACDHPIVPDKPPEVKPPEVSLRWLMTDDYRRQLARKYLQAAESCKEAGVPVPKEVLRFFGVGSADKLSTEVLTDTVPLKGWTVEDKNGILIVTADKGSVNDMPPNAFRLQAVVKYKE